MTLADIGECRGIGCFIACLLSGSVPDYQRQPRLWQSLVDQVGLSRTHLAAERGLFQRQSPCAPRLAQLQSRTLRPVCSGQLHVPSTPVIPHAAGHDHAHHFLAWSKCHLAVGSKVAWAADDFEPRADWRTSRSKQALLARTAVPAARQCTATIVPCRHLKSRCRTIGRDIAVAR